MRLGPKYKICRRLGSGIFSKCQTTRFTISEGKKKLGAKQGRKHRTTKTEFGGQLLEKQKIRFSYGLNERQLVNYVKKSKGKKGVQPAQEVFRLLETRLDNVIFRMGLVPSRQFARQSVTHGHIMVNNIKVRRPSYEVRAGDVIGVRPESRQNGIFRDKAEQLKDYSAPGWLALDKELVSAKVLSHPSSSEQSPDLNFASIVQFYSRV